MDGPANLSNQRSHDTFLNREDHGILMLLLISSIQTHGMVLQGHTPLLVGPNGATTGFPSPPLSSCLHIPSISVNGQDQKVQSLWTRCLSAEKVRHVEGGSL